MPDCASSDGDLMRAVKKDDSLALVELIGRWETRLLAFIYRFVQNESVARDLVQETFVRIYDSRQRYDLEKPFSTWMFTIAANLCRNHQRWILRHNETSMESAGDAIDQLTPVNSLDEKERQLRIARAIASLPHDLRLTVL